MTERAPASPLDRRPKTEAELRDHIAACPVSGNPQQMRHAFATLAGPQPRLSEITRGGRRCLVVGEGPELVWFHGGGYVFGAPETHATLATALAAHGLRVVLPEYRLSPEDPWPAMLEDAHAVLSDSGPVIAGGDSAGGHLALVAAQTGADLKGLALVSPNTDRSGASQTRGRDGDAMNDDASDAALARQAMPDRSGKDPAASPLLGELAGLPPVHLEAVGAEILLDDSLLLARAMALADCEVSLHVTPGLMHMHTLWPDCLPEGAASLARIAAFARRQSGAAQAG